MSLYFREALYYGPLRHPKMPSLTVTGYWLVVTTDHMIGASRVACVSLMYILPPLPRRSV
jgi:hypothetical protein